MGLYEDELDKLKKEQRSAVQELKDAYREKMDEIKNIKWGLFGGKFRKEAENEVKHSYNEAKSNFGLISTSSLGLKSPSEVIDRFRDDAREAINKAVTELENKRGKKVEMKEGSVF